MLHVLKTTLFWSATGGFLIILVVYASIGAIIGAIVGGYHYQECRFERFAIQLDQNSVKKIGVEAAHKFRKKRTDMLANLLDALSFYSKKTKRFEKTITFSSQYHQKKNEKCVESILKALNNFFLDSQLIPIESEWLKLLFRSCLRNYALALLMNGDVDEIIRLSESYGALFRFLDTLAKANPVELYEEEYQEEDKQCNENASGSNSKPTSLFVHPFELIMGKEEAVHSSATAALGHSLLQQFCSFSRAIDEHCKLFSKSDNRNQQQQSMDNDELTRLESISTLCKRVILTVDEHQKNANTSSASSSLQNVFDVDLNRKYCDAMKELQFATISFDGSGKLQIPYSFRYQLGSGSSIGMANQRLKRISRELSDMPLTSSSAVFIRTSEEHLDALKVLITGPEGTPYENGCFEFDFFLDANFPTAPPKVLFKTTVSGYVRFNPNLYNCGKVCLSLLGTWYGTNESQKWNTAHSSISQVITSIQGLILVPDPYFNEPSFESKRGTEAGRNSSNSYNEKIQQLTFQRAIVEQMCNPPIGFEEVIRKHFWLKRDQIMAQMERWGERNRSVMTHRWRLNEEFEKLKRQMIYAKGNI